MRFSLALTGLFLTCGPGRSQEKPAAPPHPIAAEELLSADTLLYFRYDGYEKHRRAYDKTALAKIMQEDLGDLFDSASGALKDAIVKNLLADAGNAEEAEAPGGDKAKGKQPLEKLVQLAPAFLNYLWRHGVVVGLDVDRASAARLLRNLQAVDNSSLVGVRLTVVFSEGGKKENRAILFPLLETLTTAGDGVVHKHRVGQRLLHEVTQNDSAAVWWQEGQHAVCVLSATAERPRNVVKRQGRNLTSTALYQAVVGFDRYETDMRGFVNLEKIVALLTTPDHTAGGWAQLQQEVCTRIFASQLGLTGLKSLTFHLGFEGKCQRSTVVLQMASREKRAGLLRLISAGLRFDPEKLPVLPPDAESVSVHQVDWQNAYEVLGRMVLVYRLAGLLNDGTWAEDPFGLDVDLGGDVRDGLLKALGPTTVLYNALSEGPFILGQGVAVQVKDEKKLRAGLHALSRALAKATEGGVGLSFQKKTYRGVDLFVLTGTGMAYLPVTYTVHRGWLVIGAFPQSVKGYILRTEGGRRTWKAPSLVQEALKQAGMAGQPRSQLAAVTVADPRPEVEIGLSLLPVLLHFVDESKTIAASSLPNARTVSERLFPSVTVCYDDDNALRWESHYAMWVPSGCQFLLLEYGGLGFSMNQRWTVPATGALSSRSATGRPVAAFTAGPQRARLRAYRGEGRSVFQAKE